MTKTLNRSFVISEFFFLENQNIGTCQEFHAESNEHKANIVALMDRLEKK